jgi:diacylglycerol kinase (ATP)
MNKNFFSVNTWFRRFRYAWHGIRISFHTEHTMWIHLFSTIIVIILSVIKGVSAIETIVLVFSIGSVWVAELFNTAIEKLADKVCMELNEKVKIVKDLAAGAVLVASIVALATGLLIFIPKFL